MLGTYITKTLDETKELATKVAKNIAIGTVIALIGDLGTGKTVFAQGFAKAMGIKEAVGSPTFKLVSEYEGLEHWLYHIDCYRLKNAQQFMNIGGEEYLDPIKGITLIEWADIIEEILPNETIMINFKRISGKFNHREISIS
ncbi:MAG: tRNA (adenosine(37)-N6)-threonylcarbamoyltransferase complex ATPase subunit type 1 TsaE [Candidatus Marinimicrobia bacterium]|nr:tRNA (adenosine(37)-N6)-threonylcarbamoyltransferase complex ATPase subunit type 1 TsaE [Candidatus Neomarinimicrobiota bacterium]